MPKIVYKADDGSEHQTEDRAIRRNQIAEASREVEKAVRNLCSVIGSSALTADGKPIHDHLRSELWAVVWGGEFPRLWTIRLWANDVSVDLDRYSGTEQVVVRVFDRERKNYVTWNANELYAIRANAVQAVIEASEKQLIQLRREVDQLK